MGWDTRVVHRETGRHSSSRPAMKGKDQYRNEHGYCTPLGGRELRQRMGENHTPLDSTAPNPCSYGYRKIVKNKS